MTISQPLSSDKLNSPDHSLSHRVFANDTAAPAKSIVVDANGYVGIGDETPEHVLDVATSTIGAGTACFEVATADANGFTIINKKARGTVASPTAITTGDTLGIYSFQGYSGAAGYVSGAQIRGVSSGTIATTRVPGELQFWTSTDAAPSVPTKRMVIDNAGNTMIGDGGTTNYIKISNVGNVTLEGTSGLALPHMQQSDTTDQNITNIANAQVLTFNSDDHHFNITRTSSSRFTITKAGSYLIAFSGVATGVINETIEVWLRVDGGDVPFSNTIYTFKSNGANTVISVTSIYRFAANQYFEFWTWGSAVTSKWDSTAAASTPTRPGCPALIMTCNYIGQD